MKRIILFIALLIAGKSFAQSTATKIENTGKQVEAVVENLGRLKGLFGKKDQNKSEVSKQNVSDNASTAKVSPDVKYIDASQIYPFINGKAIVKKGQAYAVIDTAGQFIVPYSKYETIAYTGKDFLLASTESSSIVLNNKGGMALDLGALYKKGNYTTTVGDYVLVRPQSARNFTLIDGAGKSYPITMNALSGGRYTEFVKVSEQVVIVRNVSPNNVSTYGFKGLNNQLLAEPVYTSLSDFTDGFAIYGQVDNYGEVKFGITDANGKKTVPPTFSNRPSALGDGYFRVNAPLDSDFIYAIIDRNGKVLYKKTKGNTVDHSFQYYEDGYFFNGRSSHMMDTAGKIIDVKAFLRKAGLNTKYSEFAGFITYSDDTFSGFNTRPFRNKDGLLTFVYTREDNTETFGLLNLQTGRVILGPFNESAGAGHAGSGYQHIIDPVSKLVMIRQDTGVTNKNAGFGTVENTGFMTADGHIRILQSEKKSGW